MEAAGNNNSCLLFCPAFSARELPAGASDPAPGARLPEPQPPDGASRSCWRIFCTADFQVCCLAGFQTRRPSAKLPAAQPCQQHRDAWAARWPGDVAAVSQLGFAGGAAGHGPALPGRPFVPGGNVKLRPLHDAQPFAADMQNAQGTGRRGSAARTFFRRIPQVRPSAAVGTDPASKKTVSGQPPP